MNLLQPRPSQEVIGPLREQLETAEPGEPTYQDLLARPDTAPPNSYRVTSGQRNVIQQWLKMLCEAGDFLIEPNDHQLPCYKEPRPVPILGIHPRTVPPPQADLPGEPLVDPGAEGERSVSS